MYLEKIKISDFYGFVRRCDVRNCVSRDLLISLDVLKGKINKCITAAISSCIDTISLAAFIDSQNIYLAQSYLLAPMEIFFTQFLFLR